MKYRGSGNPIRTSTVFPGRYKEEDPGSRFAQLRLEESLSTHEIVRGVTDSTRLFSGALFMLKHDDRKDQTREYLVASARYDVDSGTFRSGGERSVHMTTQITGLPSEVPYRPARNTPVPFIPGPQTARVVGPKDQEIWTDVHGRVKIQFAWDRDGKFDENSSCFVRVSQAWAGSGFGAMHVPRVGQEVLVAFVDGDIDRPIVIGRVYNDQQKPSPSYKLPTGATQSGIGYAAEDMQLICGLCKIAMDQKQIVLTAFDNEIKLDAKGITINGLQVFINSPG